MGLLTDPSAGQGKIIKFLLKYYAKFCAVLYFAGIIYFCLLASPQLNNSTYISENALLPGLVESKFKHDGSAMDYYEELREEMKKYEDTLPYPWLLAKLRQIGLDTYTHEFTLNYPLGPLQRLSGKNVYGILRAPRASSTEALVLSVPFRPPVSVHESTAPSIAIMLAFAKFAIKEKYWAKDIIFLITEHEQIGMQAWLEAYHGVASLSNNSLIWGDVKGRAGAIQAAINLELHHSEISQIDLKIEGLNGQLPNLDLFNLAVRMCLNEGVNLTFKNRVTQQASNPFRDWNLSLHGLKVLPKKLRIFYKHWRSAFDIYVRMVGTQATGIPNGNHGLYYRFGIQAITLEGFGPENPKSSRVSFYTIGRILEGTFRSLNNLLERFHQSYFFYLLSGHDRYISIGLYIPAVSLVAAALFIKAYAKWCQLHENNKDKDTDQTVEKRRLTSEEIAQIEAHNNQLTEQDWWRRFNEDCEIKTEDNLSLGHICLVFVSTHILGFSLRGFPKYAASIGVKYGYSIDLSIFAGVAILSILSALVMMFIKRPCRRSMMFLNILALIELGTSLLCVAMYNISLAMFLSLIYIPLAMIINPCKCRIYNFIQKLCWLCAHPLMLLLIVVYFYTSSAFPQEPYSEQMVRTLNSSIKALRFSIEDALFYGNWLYNFMTMIMLSIWLCFWYVSFAPIESNDNTKISSRKKNE